MLKRVQNAPRNTNIDFLKFLYSLAIVFYHFYSETSLHFISGRYAVEFFLITAGIFFFKTWRRNEDPPPPHIYIYKRYTRFMPWTTTAFIFTFILRRVVIAGNTPRQLINYLSRDIWEVLLIKMNGMNNGSMLLNSPAWTVSAMLLVEIVMIGCLFCNKKVFMNVIIPISIIVGFGFWRQLSSAEQEKWIGFTTFGVFRAWLVYCCAWPCLRLSEYIHAIDFKPLGKVALTVVETLCVVFTFLVMTHKATRYWQWCTLLAFVILIAIALSGHSLWSRVLEKAYRFVKFLGAFSLSIYLSHLPVLKYFEYIYPDTGVLYAHVGQYTIVVIISALAHYFITTGLIKFWRSYGAKIKDLFINAV